jgi:hypothetical protein
MKNKCDILSVLLFLFITLIAASSSYALTISNATIQYINCEGFCFESGLTFTYDRDNTGTDAESNGIVVTDGQGNVLYTNGGASAVPGTYTIQGPWCVTYNTAPKSNPITIQLISPAGNGYSEQIAYQTTGTCSTAIPTMNEWGMIIFIMFAGLGAVFYLRRQRKAVR